MVVDKENAEILKNLSTMLKAGVKKTNMKNEIIIYRHNEIATH